jgi:hypothetical protein
MPMAEEQLMNLSFTKGKSIEPVIQLSSMICMLISAKFLEKTYPGV